MTKYSRRFARRQWRNSFGGKESFRTLHQAGREGSFRKFTGRCKNWFKGRLEWFGIVTWAWCSKGGSTPSNKNSNRLFFVNAWHFLKEVYSATMTTAEIHDELRRMSRPSLTKCAENGYWFCERCERIVNLSDDNDSPATCPRCRHKTAVWQKPVFWRAWQNHFLW